MAAWGYLNWGNLLIEELSIISIKLCKKRNKSNPIALLLSGQDGDAEEVRKI